MPATGLLRTLLPGTPGSEPCPPLLLSRTGEPHRFPTASADRARHGLSLHGDRQLKAGRYTVPITQLRMGHLAPAGPVPRLPPGQKQP